MSESGKTAYQTNQTKLRHGNNHLDFALESFGRDNQ